jgi:hypothetical protein
MSKYHDTKLTRFDFDVYDFMGSEDVAVMDAETGGQYLFLLCQAWMIGKDCTLPGDEVALVKLSRSTTGNVHPVVLKKFRKTDDGRLVNDRLLIEWRNANERQQVRIDKATVAGLASGEARREPKTNLDPTQTNSKGTQGELKGTPKPTQAVSKPEGAGLQETAPPKVVSDSIQIKGNRLASDEGYDLCRYLQAELKQTDYEPEWLPLADEVLEYAGGASSLSEVKEMFSWGLKHEHFTKFCTGMKSFLTLLKSSSDRGLKNQFYAARRAAEIQSKPKDTLPGGKAKPAVSKAKF